MFFLGTHWVTSNPSPLPMTLGLQTRGNSCVASNSNYTSQIRRVPQIAFESHQKPNFLVDYRHHRCCRTGGYGRRRQPEHQSPARNRFRSTCENRHTLCRFRCARTRTDVGRYVPTHSAEQYAEECPLLFPFHRLKMIYVTRKMKERLVKHKFPPISRQVPTYGGTMRS